MSAPEPAEIAAARRRAEVGAEIAACVDIENVPDLTPAQIELLRAIFNPTRPAARSA